MLAALAIFVGAGTGGVLRWLVHLTLDGRVPAAGLPLATLVTNVLGCLGIGLLAGLFGAGVVLRPEIRLGLVVGLLGGFTTFSTYARETIGLLQRGDILRAALYLALSNTIGLAAAWAGFRLALPLAARFGLAASA